MNLKGGSYLIGLKRCRSISLMRQRSSLNLFADIFNLYVSISRLLLVIQLNNLKKWYSYDYHSINSRWVKIMDIVLEYK